MTNNKREKTYVHMYNNIDKKKVHIREIILADMNRKNRSLFTIKRCSL